MSDITVTSVTQRIVVDAATGTASVILAGPVGPPGPEGDYHMYVGPTPPPSPEPNDFWVDNDTAAMYMYYNDGTSSQWIEIGSFDPAQIDAALIAADPDAQAVLDARYVRDVGDTMTGDLTTPRVNLNAIQPTVSFYETDQAVDARRWRLAVAAGVLYLQVMNDAETVVAATPITITRSGLVTFNGSVAVPTPTAANHAARKDYVDTADALKVAKAGDTMTGNLEISKNGASIGLRGAAIDARAYVNFKNATTGETLYVLWNEGTASGGLFVVAEPALDGITVRRYLARFTDDNDGTVDFTGAPGGVNVPAITGVSQAAQVTAYDATTGRLAIGGREIGDTGSRDVSSLLNPDWFGMDAAKVYLRRSGQMAQLSGDVQTGGSPASAMLTLPVGFRPLGYHGAFTVGFLLRSELAEHLAQWYRINPINGEVIPVWAPMAPYTNYCRFHVTWMTEDAWPGTLPGVATP